MRISHARFSSVAARAVGLALAASLVAGVIPPASLARMRPKPAAHPAQSLAATPPSAPSPVAAVPASTPPVTPTPISPPLQPAGAGPVPLFQDTPPPASPVPLPLTPIVGAPVAAASLVDLPAGSLGAAAFLPLNARAGAAAFGRRGAGWIVFDERRQIDLTALRDDPVFAQTTAQVLTGATLLRVPLAEGNEIRLAKTEGGVIVTVQPSPPPPAVINVTTKPTQLLLPVAGSNQVITVPDPETGQNLLVGTLQGAPAGVPVARRVPAFVVEPTWQGVLIEPIADTVVLRATPDGFAVDPGGEGLSAAAGDSAALAASAFLTRRFEIPSAPVDMLFRRLQTEVNDAGAAPAQTRGRPRKAAATTLIALGLGVEAQAMLRLASGEDPRLITDADATGLTAIAAMLGGRPGETDGITNPALDGSDEIAFWRAVRTAQTHEGAPEAAAVFAATVNLVLSYPIPLRDALLPLAVETMALGGAPDAADAVLAKFKDDPALEFARAIRLEAAGSVADALAKYDAITLGRDRLLVSRAATRATLLRLKTNAITAAQASDALEQQFLNWRGDGRELALRLRVASLRGQIGAWRSAFDLLQETGKLYPDDMPVIQARLSEFMTTLVTTPAADAISPLELIALVEEHAEIVSNIGTAKIAGLMADKLLALDLPARADPVIERMMHAAPVGPAQATLGVRLATLRLGVGDVAGAQAALASSNAPGLPAELIERRGLLAAKIAARSGHTDQADAILIDVGTAAADDLRATTMTEAQDWVGAANALQDLIAKTVPATGPLTPEQQDVVLRLASALSRGGNVAGLNALAAKQGPRMDSQRAGMFRLLTAAPVSTVADLARSSTELALVKTIPGGISAIGAR